MSQSPNERLVTVRQAAETIGVNYRQLLCAVNERVIPSYRMKRSRTLVKISEVISCMAQPSAHGGCHE